MEEDIEMLVKVIGEDHSFSGKGMTAQVGWEVCQAMAAAEVGTARESVVASAAEDEEAVERVEAAEDGSVVEDGAVVERVEDAGDYSVVEGEAAVVNEEAAEDNSVAEGDAGVSEHPR
ncbi:unnamed protein product [Rhodiola kirilowii]